MKHAQRRFLLFLLPAMLIGHMNPAQAHPYMIGDNFANYTHLSQQAQAILDQTMLPFVGCNLWSQNCAGQSAIWASIPGQSGPSWINTDHGANREPSWHYAGTGVRDDHHWLLLERVLDPAFCMDGLPPGRAMDIRNVYNHNKVRVLATEVTVRDIRIQANVAGCGNDKRETITTGQVKSLCVGAMTFCIVTQCFDAEIPSLFGSWGGGPLLNEAHPLLRDLLANMTAAYMTIGDSRAVDYWSAFMGRLALTFVKELLPGLLANLKSDEETMGNPAFHVTEAMLQAFRNFTIDSSKQDKANCPPWGEVPGLQETIRINDIPVVGGLDVHVTLEDWRMCNTLVEFSNQFNCNAFACRPQYFATKSNQGDLNADGQWNLTSYQLAQGNPETFLGYECADYPTAYSFSQAPQGNLDEFGQRVTGTSVSDGNWTFNTVMEIANRPYWFQWYHRPPGAPDYAPLGAATTNPVRNLVNLAPGDHYFYVEVLGRCCAATRTSSEMGVRVVPIIYTVQPPARVAFVVGEELSTGAFATISDGSPLEYQWYRRVGGASEYAPFGVPNSDGSLVLDASADENDAGFYFCRAISTTHGHHRDSNVMEVVATFFSTSIYNANAGTFQNPAIVLSPGTVVNINTGANPPIWQMGGTTYNGEVDNGAAVFRFADVRVEAGCTFNMSGHRPLSIASAKDIIWKSNLPVPAGTLGGGPGGSGGTGGAGGTGGTGGGGGTAGAGGQGGYGGIPNNHDHHVCYGVAGGAGGAGGSGHNGATGLGGSPGGVGAPGFNDPDPHPGQGGAGAQQTAGVGGGGGASGAGAPAQGAVSEPGYHGSPNPGGDGAKGHNGYDAAQPWVDPANAAKVGQEGAPGGHGTDAVYPETVLGYENTLLLVAGSGGGGGGGGQGGGCAWGSTGVSWFGANFHVATGGGGGGGAAGGGGGGPQNGGTGQGATQYSDWPMPPARGAAGGGGAGGPVSGGRGGDGGTGGAGGTGASGAGGGGAIILAALGLLRVEAAVDISAGPQLNGGANGGTTGVSGNAGAVGATTGGHWGSGHTQGNATSTRGGHGGGGGNGGHGGHGNWGNSGGQGGTAGRGVPGSAKLHGAVVSANTATVYAQHGPGTTPTQNGFFTLISAMTPTHNATQMPQLVTGQTGANINAGIIDNDVLLLDANPYAGVSTPLVGEMQEGQASTYGWLRWDYWNRALISWPTNQGPQLRTLTTASGDSVYDGFDQIFVKNTNSFGTISNIGVTVDGVARLLSGNGFTEGELFPGQTWTMTVPAGTVITLAQMPTIIVAPSTMYLECQDIIWDTVIRHQVLATDPEDGDLTGTITYSIDPDPGIPFVAQNPGMTYTVTYSVTDSTGFTAENTRTLIVRDSEPPVFSGASSSLTIANAAMPTSEEELRAGIEVHDACEGPLTFTVSVEDGGGNSVPVPIPDPGIYPTTYTIVYSAEDSHGNVVEVERILEVVALKLPVITLEGSNPIDVECAGFYLDPGVRAWDPEAETWITEFVQTLLPIEFTHATPPGVGVYTVTYRVPTPSYPHIVVQKSRTVYIKDTLAPTITLANAATLGVPVGIAFSEPGVTAWDACEGDLSHAIVRTIYDEGGNLVPEVNTSLPDRIFTITYDVVDNEGNPAPTETRTVVVGHMLEYTGQPQGARLYTTDAPHALEAAFENGVFVTGRQWFRDNEGLGVEPGDSPALLEIDPAVHDTGAFTYHLEVYDAVGTHASDMAAVEIGRPLDIVEELATISLQEGQRYAWRLVVEGGLGTLSYQWYFRTLADKDAEFEPVMDGAHGDGNYSGATTNTLLFMPFTEVMAGQYQVEVTDEVSGSIIVGPAMLYYNVGIPAASALGLMALAMAAAAGGIVLLRRRK